MSHARFHLVLAAVLGLASPGLAQPAGDAEAGRVLAEQHCVRCHDIAPGGAFKQEMPSFAAIAVFRSADQITDRIWFPPMHARMPPFSQLLMAEDVANLTAYIVSLDTTN